MTFPTKDTFDFDFTAESDYPNWTPLQTKQNMNARTEELRLFLNVVVGILNSVMDGDSGANNVAMTPIAEIGEHADVQSIVEAIVSRLKSVEDFKTALATTVGGASVGAVPPSGLSGTTVQAILNALKVAIDSTALGQIPDGSLLDIKLSNAEGQLKDTVGILANAIINLSGAGRTTETVKGNFDAIVNLAGLGRTTETVKGLSDAFGVHQADYVRQPGYAVDTGTANHLIVTLNPAPTNYVDGMGLAVKVKVAGTAATDINVNGLGVKPVFDSLGNAVTNFRANTTYSLKYESVSGNFIVQGKGGGGNASPTDLYLGTTATVDTGQITGTNPYKVGAIIRDDNLAVSSGGQGVQIWAKTDTPSAYGIAIDSSGNVYVAYGYVRKFDSLGGQIWSNLSAAGARKVAVDSSGNVYAAYYNSSGDAVVKKINSSGADVWTLTDIGYAYDIAVDSSGNVYVAYRQSAGTTTVRKLNSSGVQIWALSDLASAQGIAVDSSGNVYATYYNAVGTTSVRKLSLSGVQIWAKTDIGYAYGVAVDSLGNVYVACENTVRKLDSSGNQVWVNSQISQPRGIAVDQFGNVYVAYDNAVNTISVRRFYASGVVAWSLSDVGHAQDVVVDNSGIVYVAYFNTSGTTQVRKLYGIAYYTLQ